LRESFQRIRIFALFEFCNIAPIDDSLFFPLPYSRQQMMRFLKILWIVSTTAMIAFIVGGSRSSYEQGLRMRNVQNVEFQEYYIEKRPNNNNNNNNQLLRSTISSSSTVVSSSLPQQENEANTSLLLQFMDWNTAIVESHGFKLGRSPSDGNNAIEEENTTSKTVLYTNSRFATLTLACPQPNDSMLLGFMAHSAVAATGNDEDVENVVVSTLLFQQSLQHHNHYHDDTQQQYSYWKSTLYGGQSRQQYYTPIFSNGMAVHISILGLLQPSNDDAWIELTAMVCGSFSALNFYIAQKSKTVDFNI
jgi:hypothetical protein